MYWVRYLEQTDKMSEQVCLWMLEEVYASEVLLACVQQSAKRQQKARRVRHFTALSVLWFVLAMVLWSRLSQGRVWDKLTHWLQDRFPEAPEEPAGASALSYQRALLGVEPVQWLFEYGVHGAVYAADPSSVVSWTSADGSGWQLVQCARYPSQRTGLRPQWQSVRQGGLSAGTGGDADRMWQSCHGRAAPGGL